MIGWVIAIIVIIISSLRIVIEYERGVVFTLGKFTGIRKPGLRLIIPVFQKWQKVDMRTRVVDVPDQETITKDNVSVQVNAVLYFRVSDPERVIIKVNDYEYAIAQLAQTSMRDVIGEVSLDQLLNNRDGVSNRIRQIVDKATDPWGIKVLSVDLKHINLPGNLIRTMAKEAEAERERRAVILRSEGELVASDNLTKAAFILNKAEGGIHLRTLAALNDISSDQTNTIVFAVPLEVLGAYESIKNGVKHKK
ncbi:MAG: slipin family protein [Candidatus Cloacimonetes bacterium]|nr:slipin family protein [Candidatus Cloacimonadota bacterium]MCF8012751.1 slipin family protein [Candidatus Woesearchaeota archaeon]